MFGYQRRQLGAAREDNEGSGRGDDYGPVFDCYFRVGPAGEQAKTGF